MSRPRAFAQKSHVRFGQHATEFGDLALQPQQTLITHHQLAPLPDAVGFPSRFVIVQEGHGAVNKRHRFSAHHLTGNLECDTVDCTVNCSVALRVTPSEVALIVSS